MPPPDRFGLQGHPDIQAAHRIQFGSGPLLLIAVSGPALLSVPTWLAEYGTEPVKVVLIACSTVPVVVAWWLWNRARRMGQSSQPTVIAAAASIPIINFLGRCALDWRTGRPLSGVDWVILTALIFLSSMAAAQFRRR